MTWSTVDGIRVLRDAEADLAGRSISELVDHLVDEGLDRAESTSFVAVMGDEPRAALLEDVAGLIARAPETAGRQRFDYPHTTQLHCWSLGA